MSDHDKQPKKSRADYMREFMRRKRGTPPERFKGPRDPAASPGRPHSTDRQPRGPAAWLPRLRTLYAALLRAQRELAAYQNDALRLHLDPAPPSHLLHAVAEADAAYDAHAAAHPELAAEYVARHEADQLRRVADRITLRRARDTAPGTGPRTKGRPRLTPLPTRTELVAAEHAARVAREAAYAAYTAALDTPPASMREASRIQTSWTRARAAHERAADALAAFDQRTAAEAERTATAAATRAEDDATLAILRQQIAELLAPYPVVRAPLRDHDDPAAVAANATRRERYHARKQPQPITAAALAAFGDVYSVHTSPDGERYLARTSTGRRVRADTVTTRGAPAVRTLDLLDALAPCGLV